MKIKFRIKTVSNNQAKGNYIRGLTVWYRRYSTAAVRSELRLEKTVELYSPKQWILHCKSINITRNMI